MDRTPCSFQVRLLRTLVINSNPLALRLGSKVTNIHKPSRLSLSEKRKKAPVARSLEMDGSEAKHAKKKRRDDDALMLPLLEASLDV